VLLLFLHKLVVGLFKALQLRFQLRGAGLISTALATLAALAALARRRRSGGRSLGHDDAAAQRAAWRHPPSPVLEVGRHSRSQVLHLCARHLRHRAHWGGGREGGGVSQGEGGLKLKTVESKANVTLA
jgi:hypothetical protein